MNVWAAAVATVEVRSYRLVTLCESGPFLVLASFAEWTLGAAFCVSMLKAMKKYAKRQCLYFVSSRRKSRWRKGCIDAVVSVVVSQEDQGRWRWGTSFTFQACST